MGHCFVHLVLMAVPMADNTLHVGSCGKCKIYINIKYTHMHTHFNSVEFKFTIKVHVTLGTSDTGTTVQLSLISVPSLILPA